MLLFVSLYEKAKLLFVIFTIQNSAWHNRCNKDLLNRCSPYWASLVAQLEKNLPAMQETPVQFQGQEDLLEKGQATHHSILGLPWWLSW